MDGPGPEPGQGSLDPASLLARHGLAQSVEHHSAKRIQQPPASRGGLPSHRIQRDVQTSFPAEGLVEVVCPLTSGIEAGVGSQFVHDVGTLGGSAGGSEDLESMGDRELDRRGSHPTPGPQHQNGVPGPGVARLEQGDPRGEEHDRDAGGFGRCQRFGIRKGLVRREHHVPGVPTET